MDFLSASGALGFDGRGYFWEQPFRWLGLLDSRQFTIITKTLTFLPRRGNLRMWCPWRCVRFCKDGVVNCVGLTNPGYLWWLNKPYRYILKKGYDVIVSIMPESPLEAKEMVSALNYCKIVGIEINSCPNVDHDNSVEHICKIVKEC